MRWETAFDYLGGTISVGIYAFGLWAVNKLAGQTLDQVLGDASGVTGVRLRSVQRIDEPIVAVQLSVGCPARLTRQFTAFIDPPGMNAEPMMPSILMYVSPSASPVLVAGVRRLTTATLLELNCGRAT